MHRLALGVGVISLVGCLWLGLAWLNGIESGTQRQVLPDGSVVELLGVTRGKSTFITGVRWQKFLWPHLNPLQQRWLTHVSESSAQNIAPDTLVLWVRRRPVAQLGSARTTVASEDGELIDAGDAFGASLGDDQVEPWFIATYPRRARSLTVRKLSTDSSAIPQTAQFIIPNPDAVPHPTWNAQPLPQSIRQGPFTFALTDFRTAVRQDLRPGPVPDNERPWTRAAFRITRNGLAAPAWYPRSIEYRDATGNFWRPMYAPHRSAGSSRVSSMVGVLSPREVYRVKVEFSTDSDFAAGDLWTVRIPLAEPGTVRALGESCKRGRFSLQLREICGLGAKPHGFNSSLASGPPYVTLAVTPAEIGRVTLLRALDDQGRNSLVPHSAANALDGVTAFRFTYSPGAKWVQFTFAVHPGYLVEFQARPAYGPADSSAATGGA